MLKKGLISFVVDKCSNIRGIKAITLGGSYAVRLQKINSDIDIGLYYKNNKPIDLSSLRCLANEINDYKNPAISNIGQWGKWINGGAWLTIKNNKVNFSYRDLDFISEIINESREGKKQSDYYQQPVFGFHSYIYCAEIKFCKILHDPYNYIKKFKDKIKKFPRPLKNKIINSFLWDAEFTLRYVRYVRDCCEKEEIYIVTGSLVRIFNDLIQVLYAINERYFIGDKRLYREIDRLKKLPHNFLERMDNILSSVGEDRDSLTKTMLKTKKIFKEVVDLTDGFYKVGETYKYKL